MVVRFIKDYRSRAWMCRYAAGAVVDIDRPEVLVEAVEGGFAEAVVEPADDAVEPEPESNDPSDEDSV